MPAGTKSGYMDNIHAGIYNAGEENFIGSAYQNVATRFSAHAGLECRAVPGRGGG